MVTSGPEPVGYSTQLPRFIYLCGCDGVGKSTQAKQLLTRLTVLGVQSRPLWLRFPFCLSLPLFAYARWQGYSWREESDGVRHGYWDFRRSWLLRTLLPWVLLVDAALAALGQVYLPLWLGQTIVCERFVLDLLVDLVVGFVDPDLPRRWPGRLYPHLLPLKAAIVMLDLEADTIRARRADLQTDWRLEARLEAFRLMAQDQGLAVLSSQSSVLEVSQRIWKMINDGCEG
ncbi:MAG: thymidylate kinase-like protein [Anaerolineae bacterium]|nr:thymidylate kinase-like protein [Anaerolineae bacterium]